MLIHADILVNSLRQHVQITARKTLITKLLILKE